MEKTAFEEYFEKEYPKCKYAIENKNIDKVAFKNFPNRDDPTDEFQLMQNAIDLADDEIWNEMEKAVFGLKVASE